MTDPLLLLQVIAALNGIIIYTVYAQLNRTKDYFRITNTKIKDLADVIDHLIENDAKHQRNIKAIDKHIKLITINKEQSQ